MTYPEPLRIDDAATGTCEPVAAFLVTSVGGTSATKGRVAILDLEHVDGDGDSMSLYLTPATRDALIDWLVAQRESERKGDAP